MTDDTQKTILPYEYRVLPGRKRIQILHPAGATYTLHRDDIRRKLDGEDHPFRELSSHETIMLETAWAMLEGK